MPAEGCAARHKVFEFGVGVGVQLRTVHSCGTEIRDVLTLRVDLSIDKG